VGAFALASFWLIIMLLIRNWFLEKRSKPAH
jgi:hypothetical protein